MATDAFFKFMEEFYKIGQDKTDRVNTGRGDQGKTGRGNRSKSDSEVGKPLLLTPFIEQNRLKQARVAARVDPDYILPGMDSYAGYLTVNKEYNANLWFWYFPVSDKKVEDTPWIISLQGGPGITSLCTLFMEIGPFRVNDSKLEEMKYSWGKNHSLLFIDNPVGAGFSFTSDDRGYATNQTTIGENLYTALQQFLTIFPELRKAPLTIIGESYAGKHIPSIGIQILWNRNRDQDQPINLHGLAIGNGWIDPLSMQRYSNLLREVGLLDDSEADQLRSQELKTIQAIRDGQIVKAYYYHSELLETIREHWKNLYNYVVPLHLQALNYTPFIHYLEQRNVRRALHVGSTDFKLVSIGVYEKLIPDVMNSVKPWLEELLENYRVMLYSGQLDIIVAYHPSVNTYNSLVFSGAEEYKTAERKPWYHDNRLAGYYKRAGNLTEVMVLGAGHSVFPEKSAQAYGLVSAFIRGQPIARTSSVVDLGPRR